MKRLCLLFQPIPVRELTDFGHWPFREVHRIVPWARTKGQAYYPDNEDRVPIKGSRTKGVPINISIDVDEHDPLLIYRHWDWYWQLEGPMPPDIHHMFETPNIRHEIVMDLIHGACQKGCITQCRVSVEISPKRG